MSRLFKEFSRGCTERFRRGRSSWKSLKYLNVTGGGERAILRMGLAPPWRAAVHELVERATSVDPRRIPHGR